MCPLDKMLKFSSSSYTLQGHNPKLLQDGGVKWKTLQEDLAGTLGHRRIILALPGMAACFSEGEDNDRYSKK